MSNFLREVSPELRKTTSPLTKKIALPAGAASVPARNLDIKNDFRPADQGTLVLNPEPMLGSVRLTSGPNMELRNSAAKPRAVEMTAAPAGRFTAPLLLLRNAD
jgi:hypothetical protein